MKRVIGLVVLFPFLLSAADFAAKFANTPEEEQLAVLEEWNLANPEDPELYVSYYNYYFSSGYDNFLSLTVDEPEGEHWALMDSTESVAGYLGGKTVYNDELLNKAFDWIDKGISRFPNRLDMRFGKIYGLGVWRKWQEYTDEILLAIDYGATHDNQWLWSKGEVVESGKEFLLETVQSYQNTLFETGNDSLLANMKTIALKEVEYYPEYVPGLTILGIVAFLQEDNESALDYLLKAETVAPQDEIVLSNIGNIYRRIGNLPKAIEYYRKIAAVPSGNEAFREEAEMILRELE